MATFVDLVDERREGGRFSAAGGAGHQHQPASEPRELVDHLGQAKFLQGRDLGLDDAQRERDRAALVERIDPHASDGGDPDRRVQLFFLLQDLHLAGLENRLKEALEVVP